MTGTNTTQRQKATATNDNSEHVVVVVFTLNRPFYPTTSSAVPSVSFLILHPREIQINSVVTDSGTEKNQTLKNQGIPDKKRPCVRTKWFPYAAVYMKRTV